MPQLSENLPYISYHYYKNTPILPFIAAVGLIKKSPCIIPIKAKDKRIFKTLFYCTTTRKRSSPSFSTLLGHAAFIL